MFENFDIKLIRLKTGEDIICFCYKDYKNNRAHLRYPKTFYFNYDPETEQEELVIIDWLPKKAYALQEAIVDLDQILLTSYSTVSFGYKYLDSLLEELDPKSDVSKSIKETLDEYYTSKDTTIH